MSTNGIKPSQMREIPPSVVCYSSALKPFLAFLLDFRGEKDLNSLLVRSVQSEVNDSVFGKEDDLLVIENKEESSDLPSPKNGRESERSRFCVSTLTHGSAQL